MEADSDNTGRTAGGVGGGVMALADCRSSLRGSSMVNAMCFFPNLYNEIAAAATTVGGGDGLLRFRWLIDGCSQSGLIQ